MHVGRSSEPNYNELKLRVPNGESLRNFTTRTKDLQPSNICSQSDNYSRPSVARPPMARYPPPPQTRPESPGKNPTAADFGCFRPTFFLENGMLCVVIRIASVKRLQ